METIKKSKNAQHEMLGFVIIILLVIIIGVIFLGIFLGNKSKGVVTIDAEMSNFLISSSAYTTECYKDYDTDYKNLGEIVAQCYYEGIGQEARVTCPENQRSCEVVNKTYEEMLKKFKPAGVLSYYKLSFYHQENLSESPENSMKFVGDIVYGNSTGCNKRGGRHFINTNQGSITEVLELCMVS